MTGRSRRSRSSFSRRKTTTPRRPCSATRCPACGASARPSFLSPTAPAAARASAPSASSIACASNTASRRWPTSPASAPHADSAAILDEAESLGIENILALRGDPPKGQAQFLPTQGGFAYAADLIRFVKGRGCFSVGAAGYPEGHVECPDKLLDWDRSAQKVDAGAEFLITQLFYDANDFLAYEDYLRNKRHVRAPIIPGILPFLNAAQIKKFTSMCGAKLPEAVVRRIEALGDDESVRRLGVEVCTDLCRRLLDHGVPGIHFYCLNRVPSCAEVLHNLGLV